MRRLPFTALAVALAAAMSVSGRSAVADPPDATAWWWAASDDALGLPADTPTPVEPGGLYVAGSPGGTVGASALRLEVADNQAVGDVVLVIDTDEETGAPKAAGTIALEACPATRVWAPEEGGPLARVPDCDPSGLAFGSVVGGTVRIPAGGLVRNGVLNIVLRPASGSAFQVAFDKPGADAVQVTTFPTEGDGGEEGPPPGYEDFAGFDVGAALEVPTVPDAPALGPVAVPPLSVGPTTTTTAADTGGGTALAPRRAAAGADDDRSGQVVAALVLVGLILVYLGLLQAPGRTPHLLGPFARDHGAVVAAAVPSPSPTEVPRGIGRFARPRAGPTPRL